MRATIPALAVLALTLSGCAGSGTPEVAETASTSPSSSPNQSPTASPSSTPTKTPTPEPTTAAPEVPLQEPTPVAPPAAPEAAPLPDPASLTPGEYCATYTPVSSGEMQLCDGITQGYIDPVTGASIEQAPAAPVPAPVPPTSPEDADPNDPSTWQGKDESGNDWAVIGPPPPGV